MTISDDDYSWDDIPMSLNTLESATSLLDAYQRYRNGLTDKDIDSQLVQGQSRSEFLANLALHSTEATGVLFRKNIQAHEIKILAWLTSSISDANKLALGMTREFSGISQEDIRRLVQLSQDPSRIVDIPRILAERHGIVLIIRPGFPSMRMDGCASLINGGRPMIGLSLRYNRYDNFWFTLIHELSHIHLHIQSLGEPIVDDLDQASDDEIEVEANAFARELLVPRREWRVLYEHRGDEKLLEKVSAEIGTHPEIVAGLIRYASNNYKLYPNHHRAANVKAILGFEDA